MKYIYVDYENINTIEKLPKIQGKYFFFIGENQAKINASLVYSTNGVDVTWIKIDGSGKNALDFHIAYYLGKSDEDKSIEHFILSKDTGFDPLVKHLKSKGIKIKRIKGLYELENKIVKVKVDNTKKIEEVKVESENYKKTVDCLTRLKKVGGRPKTKDKLQSHIRAQIKGLNNIQINEIVEDMVRKKLIKLEEGSSLKYLF